MSEDKELIPFQLFDAADDEMILAEIKGEHVKTLAYSFMQDGKSVEGLSKKGIDFARDQLARQGIIIREEMAHRPIIDEEAAYVSIVATRFIKQGEVEAKADSAIASKRQPRVGQKRGGGTFNNPFFFEQATGKASRNAVDRHIPEDLRKQIISMAKAEGKIVDVTPAKKVTRDDSNDPASDDAKTKIRDLHVAISTLKGDEYGKGVYTATKKKHGLFTVDKATMAQARQIYADLKKVYDEIKGGS